MALHEILGRKKSGLHYAKRGSGRLKTRISKALVTGGAGFVGSHIVDQLLAKGIETYVIDNLSTGSMDNLVHHERDNNRMLHLITGDINDVEKLLSDIVGIDVVFHEAAIASV